MKILNFFNLKTLLVLITSQVSVYLAVRFQITLNFNLLLFGLVIAFPLMFSIQSAFKRRDRALEYFSMFKGASLALRNSFHLAEDLPPAEKEKAKQMLTAMSGQLIHQLEHNSGNFKPIQEKIDSVFTFVDEHREEISNRNILRMVRYFKDISESSAYLVSLVRHRTMSGLRFYSVFFITIFPLIQAPIILYRLEPLVPIWLIYVLVGISSLVLVTLSNFQQMIEYPFDPRGMDNIQVRDFNLD